MFDTIRIARQPFLRRLFGIAAKTGDGVEPHLLEITGKSRDQLQAVIALLKEQDLDVALQFVNYR